MPGSAAPARKRRKTPLIEVSRLSLTVGYCMTGTGRDKRRSNGLVEALSAAGQSGLQRYMAKQCRCPTGLRKNYWIREGSPPFVEFATSELEYAI
jgi:hypothetical protein